MDDNELVKIIQKPRPKQTYYEKIKNFYLAVKHLTYDRYFNREDYDRIEAAHKYYTVYNTFYPRWRRLNTH